MTAIQQAPWSLRSYAGLIAATAILTVLATGRGWVGIFWAGALGIGVCNGSRAIWWLCVAVNALFLILAPFASSVFWLSIPLALIALALLLMPESRRYVFARDPESSEASDG